MISCMLTRVSLVSRMKAVSSSGSGQNQRLKPGPPWRLRPPPRTHLEWECRRSGGVRTESAPALALTLILGLLTFATFDMLTL
jgi:hypothetical protein